MVARIMHGGMIHRQGISNMIHNKEGFVNLFERDTYM